jgi:putative ABC transport system substrate-binding protein
VHGVLAAQQATTIPIVVGSAALIAQGLITDLDWPGGNITGLTTYGPEIVGNILELLKDAAPQVARVALLSAPVNNPT